MSCEEHQTKCLVQIDGSLLWASFHLPWLNHMAVVIFLVSCSFISPQEWARLDKSHDFQAKQFDWGTDYYTQLLARNKKEQECSGRSPLWHCQYYCPAALWEVEIWEVHTAVYHQPGNLTSLDQRDILPQNQPKERCKLIRICIMALQRGDLRWVIVFLQLKSCSSVAAGWELSTKKARHKMPSWYLLLACYQSADHEDGQITCHWSP